MKHGILRFGLGCVVIFWVGCASDRVREHVEDTVITTKVETALAADAGMNPFSVKVETDDGVVQLDGFVDTHDHARRAAEIARSVKGVQSVENEIIARSGLPSNE